MEFIGFVFVQILLVAAAAVVGAICWLVVRRATYQVTIGRSWALLIAFLFPLLVVFYLEAGLFAYGIAEYALGKDSFLNGIYHYPLVNGYQLVIFDKMPEMAYIEQSAGSDTNGVSEVRAVQVAGNLLLVAAHRGRDAFDWGRDKPANAYVAIDTKASTTTDYPTLEALRLDAASRGISLHLTPTDEALSRAASPGWAGRIFLVLLLTPLAVLTVWLLRKLRQLRRRSTVLGQQPHPA